MKPLLLVFGAVIVCSALFGLTNDQGPATNDKEDSVHNVEIPGFTVVGIEARTTNAREATPEGVIGKQWQKFLGEGTLERIPDRADPNVYAVYSDYVSDHNGEYSFLIGAKVKEGTTTPSGMVAKRIRAGKYAVITSDKGLFPKVVPAVWQKIFRL